MIQSGICNAISVSQKSMDNLKYGSAHQSRKSKLSENASDDEVNELRRKLISTKSELLEKSSCVKDLTKHQVDQFNSAVNFITKIDAINEVVDCLKANCVGYGSLTKIEQNKVIINTVVGYAKSIKRNKVSGSNESKLRYLFNNGEIKVSLYRPNRDNTQVRLHKVPKDEEKEIISLISEVLRKYEQIESPPGGTL